MTLQWEVKPRYGPVEVFGDARDAAEHITSNEQYIDELEVNIDENLNDEYGSIEIRGHEFTASEILYSMNQDDYYTAMQEDREFTAQNNVDSVAEQIGEMNDGEELSFEGGFTVTCIAVFDDDEEVDDGFDKDGFESALK